MQREPRAVSARGLFHISGSMVGARGREPGTRQSRACSLVGDQRPRLNSVVQRSPKSFRETLPGSGSATIVVEDVRSRCASIGRNARPQTIRDDPVRPDARVAERIATCDASSPAERREAALRRPVCRIPAHPAQRGPEDGDELRHAELKAEAARSPAGRFPDQRRTEIDTRQHRLERPGHHVRIRRIQEPARRHEIRPLVARKQADRVIVRNE